MVKDEMSVVAEACSGFNYGRRKTRKWGSLILRETKIGVAGALRADSCSLVSVMSGTLSNLSPTKAGFVSV
jgi:hypothetical protein